MNISGIALLWNCPALPYMYMYIMHMYMYMHVHCTCTTPGVYEYADAVLDGLISWSKISPFLTQYYYTCTSIIISRGRTEL